MADVCCEDGDAPTPGCADCTPVPARTAVDLSGPDPRMRIPDSHTVELIERHEWSTPVLRSVTESQLSMLIAHHRVSAMQWLAEQGIEVTVFDFETVTQAGEGTDGELVAGVWADIMVARGEPERLTWSARWHYWQTRLLALAVSQRTSERNARIASGETAGAVVDLEDYRP